MDETRLRELAGIPLNEAMISDRKLAAAFKKGDRVQFTGAKDDPKRGIVIVSPPLKPSQMKKGTVTGHTGSSGLVKVIWDGGKLNVKMAPNTLTKIKK